MSNLQGKTLFITGATRGIGLAIAKRAAQDGANIAIAAKTDQPHPQLPGTLATATAEIREAGGQALGIKTDIRYEQQISEAVKQTVDRFGGIDILINNASAINLTGTLQTPMKRFDLMHQVNTRGTFAVSQACLPYLLQADNPHILNLSPPLSLQPKWFKDHCAYTMAKYGMSLCVLGMAEEFRDQGVAVNALWPRTVIYTAAIAMLEGRVKKENCRNSEIVADAAHAILIRDSRSCSGHFFIDEEVLRGEGTSDFSQYAVDPNGYLLPDLFLD
jgi:citronellol/citronellal dehydrogenase